MYELAEINWNVLFQPPAVVFIGGVIIALAAIIAPQLRKAHQASAEARLKRQMIDRGFSADEIERVIQAGGGEDPGREKSDSSTF